MQGLYAPTQEDLEAVQSNRADAMFSNSIAGIIANIPEMRKQKKDNKYWRERDAQFSAPITVLPGGELSVDRPDSYQFGSLDNEWNKYSEYMKDNNVRVGENDYNMFKQYYLMKQEEYGKSIDSKFYAMQNSGVSPEKIRNLVIGNQQMRDSIVQLSANNPDLQATMQQFIQPKGGLYGGLKTAVPSALATGAAFAAPVVGYEGIKAGAQKAMGKETNFLKNLRGYLSPTKQFTQEAIKSDKLRKKGMWTTKDTKLIGKKQASVDKAQKALDKLQTKAGKLRKGKSQKALTKAQTNLKKATTILDTAKGKTKPMSKSAITSTLTKALKNKGVKGVYKKLVERVGRRAALGLMARVGLGTALSGTGVGTAIGVGMNITAAYQIARALAESLKEVEGDSTFSEKIWGKKTSSLEWSTF